MAWLAAAIVFIALLYFYPRFVGYSLAAVVFLGGLGGLVLWFFSAREEAEKAKVEATIRYEKKLCAAEFPIFAGFVNNSSRTVQSVSFSIEFRERGYSSEIGRLSLLTEDKIMKPSEGFGRCYKLPELKSAVPLDEIELSIPYKTITFE